MGRVVSIPLFASLSHVLGSAPGLPGFALCGATRAGRQPDHTKPAWPAFHRYHDEFYVPECRLVVLLHADPIISYLSPALLGGTPRGTGSISSNSCCSWISRALSDARRLSTTWFL